MDTRSQSSRSSGGRSESSVSSKSAGVRSKSVAPGATTGAKKPIDIDADAAEDQKDAESGFDVFDYRFIWASGLFLAIVGCLYFWWLNNMNCWVDENQEVNLTLRYANENYDQIHAAPNVSTSPTDTITA